MWIQRTDEEPITTDPEEYDPEELITEHIKDGEELYGAVKLTSDETDFDVRYLVIMQDLLRLWHFLLTV